MAEPTCHTDATRMVLSRSFALRKSGEGARIQVDVAFDGQPPDDGWRVHRREYVCPTCGASREIPV